MAITVGIYWCEKSEGKGWSLMPTPWGLGKVKGRSRIVFWGHGGFSCPRPLSCSAEAHRWEEPLFSIIKWHSVPMFHSDWVYFIYSLFEYKEKYLSENSFHLQAICFLGENEAAESRCCEHVASDRGGIFGKVPGRLFLEEKHQHFSCGTLIGNRMAVQPRQEIKMKRAGVFILVP